MYWGIFFRNILIIRKDILDMDDYMYSVLKGFQRYIPVGLS
jgi:hypothetical protein